MNAIRFSLVALFLAAPLPALASHPVAPVQLRQQAANGGALAAGATTSDNSVAITASSASGTCSSATSYFLEIELRPLAQAFTGTPTHTSVAMTKPDCVVKEYPLTTISNLAPETYKWRVRERVGASSVSSWSLFNSGNAAFTVVSVQVTPTALAFGGQKVGTQSAPQQVVLSNQSGSAITVNSTSVTGPFAVTSGPTLPAVLAQGSSLTFEVAATPPSIGTHTGTFAVDTTAPNTPHTATLSVTGADPQLTLTPTTLAFGDWGINGAAATRQVTLQNTGNAPLTVSGGTATAPFGVSGLPTSPLPAGGSTTFQVTFSPTATGPFSGTISISSDAPGGPHTVSATGTGTEPQLVLTPGSITFPDVLIGAQSAPHTFSIGNPGIGTLNLLAPTVTGPFSTTLAAGTVAQGATKSYTVTFAPTAPGNITGSVVVGSDSAGSPHTLTLAGVARAPSASVSPTSLSFGAVALGAYQTGALTLANTGDAPLTVTALTLSGSSTEFSLSGTPPLPFTVPAGGSQQFAVRFQPTNVGTRTATLTIESNRFPAGPLTVPLSGQGTGPVVSLSATALTFDPVNVGGTGQRTLTVTNTGNSALTVTGLVFSTGAASDFGSPQPLPFTVQPGASTQVTVQFKPTLGGSRTSKLTVVSSDALKPGVDVALSGVGQSPNVAVTPLSLSFGSVRVGQSGVQTVTLQNTGTGPLTVSSLTFLGNDAARFSVSGVGTPFTVGAGAMPVSIQVSFQPSTVGPASAALHVVSDDPQAPSIQVSLGGEGIAPGLALSTPTLSFGAQVVARTSSPRTFQIQNTGNAPLQVFSLGVTGSASSSFTVTQPTGSFTIAPGQQREVSVAMTAGSVGEHAARLNIQSDRPGGQGAQVDLLGLGISEVFGVSPTVLDFGVVKTGGQSSAVTVTLSNLSSETLPMSPATVTGASASEFSVVFTAAQVEPGGSATARVTYKPQSAGQHAASLNLNSSDLQVPPSSINLLGSSVSQVLEVSPAAHDFGAVAVGARVSQSFSVSNRTQQPLVVSAISSSHPAFVVEPGGPGTVEPGRAAVLTVSFAPTLEGPAFGTIGLSLEGQPESQVELSLAVSGTATKAVQEGGCAAAGGPLLSWLLLGLFIPALRRRRTGPPRTVIAPSRLLLVAALLASSAAVASHPAAPVLLKQQTTGGTTIAAGASINDTSVRITASSPSETCDSTVSYFLEIELRPLAQSFTGTPTHTSTSMTKPDCVDKEYPFTTISNLSSGAWKWRVRERVGTFSGSTWVNFNSGNAAFTVVSVQVSPTSLAFGGQKVGVQSQPLPVTFDNQSSSAVTINSASFTGPFSLVSGPALPATVGANSQAVFQVAATPPSVGNHTGTFTLVSSAGNSPHNVALSVTGADPAVTLTPTSVAFGDWGINGSPKTQSVTLQNTGNAPLTVTGATTSGPFGVSGLSGLVLGAGQSTAFTVSFSPTATGPHTGSVSISSDAPGAPHQVSLSGNGTQPQLALAPGSVTFPDVVVGQQSAPVTFSIGNTSTDTLNLLAPTVNGPFSTSLTAGTVAPGASSNHTVTFAPTAPGAITGSVVIPSDSAGPSASLSLSGVARAPVAQLSPSTVALGGVALGGSGTATVTLTNTGDATLTVTALGLQGGAAGEFTLQNAPALPFTVPAGGTQTFDVRFAPSTVGPRSASLTLVSNRYPAGPLSLPVSGQGMGPVKSVNATSLDFGPVNLGATGFRTFTVANSGNQPLSITALTFSTGAAAEFSSPQALPATVAAGASLTVSVAFAPAMGGTRSSQLTVVTDDPVAPTAQLALTGVAQTPGVSVTPLSVGFGQVRLGQTQVRTVTLQNTGTGALTISGLTFSGTDAARFSRPAGVVPVTLQPGAPGLVVQLTFQPNAVGPATATLNVATDDPQTPSVQVALAGEGIAPSLVLSETTLSFGAQVVGRPSAPRTLQIQNSGSAPLQVFSLAITGESSTAFTVADPSGPFTVPSGGSQTVAVVVRAAAVGELSARLNIQSDAPGGGTGQVDLLGLGISEVFSVTPATVEFGARKVGTVSPPVTVTLANLSAEALPLGPALITGPGAADFAVQLSATSVQPGGSVTAKITYRPQSGGAHTAQLRLSSTDIRIPSAQVTLGGSGVSRVLEAPTSSHDFGPVEVGQRLSQSFSVINKTSETATIGAFTSSHPAFLIDEGAPSTVEAGQSVAVSVTFAPTEAVPVLGTVVVGLDGQPGVSELTLAVSGTGTPAREAPSGGCAAAGGPALAWLLLGLAVPALRRRRRG
jgi:hypothetical protein